jgi:hypothetical protein
VASRNPTLNVVRDALDDSAAWERSMVAPWKPPGDDQQHLIVWVDLTDTANKATIGELGAAIVGNALPGVTLANVEQQPPF